MDFDSYLQNTIDNIGSHLRHPQHRGTGKSYNMCMSILNSTLSISGKILVLGTDKNHLKNLYGMFIRVADATASTYTLISQSEIEINGCQIIFEESKNNHKHCGLRSAPQRFVDHYTEEQFVLDGLRKLRNDLSALRGNNNNNTVVKEQTIDETTKNRIQFVLFDPVAVGWEIGLTKAVEESRKMGVPLAVKSLEDYKIIKEKFPGVDIIRYKK